MLIINELFTSIEGEVSRWGQGGMTTFVRFQGCNLRCEYCDTQRAQQQGEGVGGIKMSVQEVIAAVKSHGLKRATITGGEPLLQKDGFLSLVDGLIRAGYRLTVETNGSQSIPYHWISHPLIGWVVDYKINEPEAMDTETIATLSSDAFLKFVLANDTEFVQAIQTVKAIRKIGCEAMIAFSAVVYENVTFAQDLAGWVVAEGDPTFFVNVQLHKILGMA